VEWLKNFILSSPFDPVADDDRRCRIPVGIQCGKYEIGCGRNIQQTWPKVEQIFKNTTLIIPLNIIL
jgi:hypothetical protein